MDVDQPADDLEKDDDHQPVYGNFNVSYIEIPNKYRLGYFALAFFVFQLLEWQCQRVLVVLGATSILRKLTWPPTTTATKTFGRYPPRLLTNTLS